MNLFWIYAKHFLTDQQNKEKLRCKSFISHTSRSRQWRGGIGSIEKTSQWEEKTMTTHHDRCSDNQRLIMLITAWGFSLTPIQNPPPMKSSVTIWLYLVYLFNNIYCRKQINAYAYSLENNLNLAFIITQKLNSSYLYQ